MSDTDSDVSLDLDAIYCCSTSDSDDGNDSPNDITILIDYLRNCHRSKTIWRFVYTDMSLVSQVTYWMYFSWLVDEGYSEENLQIAWQAATKILTNTIDNSVTGTKIDYVARLVWGWTEYTVQKPFEFMSIDEIPEDYL